MRTNSPNIALKPKKSFGSPMTGRRYEMDTINGYRFGFNGKEKTDEIYGDGNGVDFGFRIYDPRIGKFLGVDPLTSKYPHLSSYAGFNNNPVYYTDPDGKECVGEVDHTKKTITIKAVYFVEMGKSGFNAANFKEMQGLNATLNSQGYTVTDEKSALHGYTIQFELEFVPVSSDTKAQTYAENEKKLTETGSTGGKTLVEGGNNIANSVILTDDATFESIPSIKETAKKFGVGTDKVLGITDVTDQHINIPEKSRGVVLTILHEIFHTLYFDKDGSKSGIGSGKELPNKSDVNALVKGIQDKGRIIVKK